EIDLFLIVGRLLKTTLKSENSVANLNWVCAQVRPLMNNSVAHSARIRGKEVLIGSQSMIKLKVLEWIYTSLATQAALAREKYYLILRDATSVSLAFYQGATNVELNRDG